MNVFIIFVLLAAAYGRTVHADTEDAFGEVFDQDPLLAITIPKLLAQFHAENDNQIIKDSWTHSRVLTKTCKRELVYRMILYRQNEDLAKEMLLKFEECKKSMPYDDVINCYDQRSFNQSCYEISGNRPTSEVMQTISRCTIEFNHTFNQSCHELLPYKNMRSCYSKAVIKFMDFMYNNGIQQVWHEEYRQIMRTCGHMKSDLNNETKDLEDTIKLYESEQKSVKQLNNNKSLEQILAIFN